MSSLSRTQSMIAVLTSVTRLFPSCLTSEKKPSGCPLLLATTKVEDSAGCPVHPAVCHHRRDGRFAPSCYPTDPEDALGSGFTLDPFVYTFQYVDSSIVKADHILGRALSCSVVSIFQTIKKPTLLVLHLGAL
ncbi:hypothetical protein M407DRAFT_97268 [Tulasnella calospora MUT 4182]|uniref:Uncharacterized protein n=1 Tax=Tulasnella calospora MUT 4182 TaxID=1051891 RepID=A0A0C3Q0I2_9AGAM|nr:hypothetical protein M407DRAFT_97268 [Tulasnella calospora MUT 4182]